jgi:protein phosphatase
MGTTLVLAVVWEDRLIVGHVGDSRLYLIRDQVPIQVTNDHSFVAEQVRIGAMTAEEAATSAMRNIILRSIGTGPDVEADVTEIPLQAGDVIVICSDGLSGHVSAEEIATYVAGSEAKIYGPSVAAHKLIDLANSRGGRDNITALIVEIVSIVPYESTL